jgi:hypothetical protein
MPSLSGNVAEVLLALALPAVRRFPVVALGVIGGQRVGIEEDLVVV